MRAPLSLARIWLGFCLRTSSWQIGGSAEARRRLTTSGTGTIVAFWHRSLAISPALCFWALKTAPDLSIRVMISRNRDGKMIAQIVRPWGFIGIHGSAAKQGKEKGGASALRSALRELEQGAIVAITPDGPRGPAEQLHPGAVALSRLANCPVVPIGMASTNPRLPTWDGLVFPLPFRRGVFICGTPLNRPDAETLQSALKKTSFRAEELLALQNCTLSDRLWRLTGTLLAPGLRIMLRIRLVRGRELSHRLQERTGYSEGTRPTGTLLWLHAASVGETLSALPLLDALLQDRPHLNVLFTTATVTGAEIASRHPDIGGRLFHRFIPYDVPRWLGRFLEQWSPDGAVFVESELWPGIIAACKRRAIPFMLINGKLSDRSARRWARAPGLVRHMLERLDWIAARGAEDAARFRALGARNVFEDGDLKQDAPPLPHDPQTLTRLRDVIGDRPVFVAASTHPGEETIIVEAALLARKKQPDLLTIIVPRHPSRGAELAETFNAPRRSLGDLPSAGTVLWIADTLGELGLFYLLGDKAFLGHSLCAPGGGHNPFEPLRLKIPIAAGPYMQNWREATRLLEGVLHRVHDARTLSEWITSPLPSLRIDVPFEQQVVPTLCRRILETLES